MKSSGETVWLYFARTEALADDPLALAWLDDEELARHERFMFEHSKREFRAAHGLTRAVVGAHTGTDPRALRFVKNEFGRPRVELEPGATDLRFNLSHTDGMLCLAVAEGVEVGADVEDARRARQTVAVADRFFAPSEVASLRSLPESQQIQRFFAYWTLKESYIKARGMGLALPLDGFAFEIEQEEPDDEAIAPRVLGDRVRLRCEPIVNDRAERWRFVRVRLSERHVGAVAIEQDGNERALACVEVTSLAGASSSRDGERSRSR
ncbi:MAG: 4'-phosphopantetheinyl transferase superfamily protein [Myxococcales bacterium]|nr:4'-phosphopantetheinyl transferase superfamily protein [Myxococcales bacterium]